MFKKPTFQEIKELVGMSWRTWLIIGLFNTMLWLAFLGTINQFPLFFWLLILILLLLVAFAKISWRTWLLIVSIFSIELILLFSLQNQVELIFFIAIVILIMMGGLLPISRFWGLIKSRNVSTASLIICFIVGALLTFIFFTIFSFICILVYALSGGAMY